MQPRIRWMVALSAVLVAPLTLGVTTAGLAQSPPPTLPSVPSQDAEATQVAQIEVLDAIGRWDALQGSSSLGATAIDPATGSVEVGWVGAVPEAVQDLADDAPDGVSVAFVAQEQSEQAITEQVLDAAASLPGEAAVTFDIDGDAVTVGVPTEAAASAVGVETLPVDAAGVAAIEQAVVDASDGAVDVDVEAVDDVAATTARRGDVQDLLGGSSYLTRWANGASIGCTSGFQAVSGHLQHFITAAHCSDYRDDLTVSSTTGQRLGVTDGAAELLGGADAFDLQLARLDLDVRNTPAIYTSNSSTLTVSGYLQSGLPAGAYLCSSGNVSGNLCNLTVTGPAVACYGRTAGGAQCVDIVRVTARTGTAFCLGDSGGPVYANGSAGTVLAAAVVSGVRLQQTGDRCSPLGYVAPIADLMRVMPGIQLRAVTVQ